MWSWANSC